MNKIIKYGLITMKDSAFLINRKYNTKLFLLPGGKPEKEESIEECMVREIKEEHNCELILNSVKFFGDFEDIAANEPNTIISMKVFTGSIKGTPEINSEIEEQKWFKKFDDPTLLSPIIKNKILPTMIEQNLI